MSTKDLIKIHNNKIIYKIFRGVFRFVFKAYLYICMFMLMEMSWRFIKYGSNNGFVSIPIWMFLVYVHIAWLDDLLIPFFNKKNTPVLIQAFFIMLLINIFEFSFGVFFKYGLDLKVWDYTNVTFFGLKANLFGVVSLYGIPAWYLISLFLIWVYPRVKALVDYPVNQFKYLNNSLDKEKAEKN